MPPYDIDSRLVIGIASSALFDLRESHGVFVKEGEAAYRTFQRDNVKRRLEPGIAMPFVKRILRLNDIADVEPRVEVVLLSRNDPDTGERVFQSIRDHCLNITRGVFLSGRSPHDYIPAFNVSLFLSGDEAGVRAAVDKGYPAGLVLGDPTIDDPEDKGLRIAFDFDGVLASDASESVYQDAGIDAFHKHETELRDVPHEPGPLKSLFSKLSQLQAAERRKAGGGGTFSPSLRIALVTARNAPAHSRLVTTLRAWNLSVDETMFLGGIEKRRVLEVFRPHIYFDDQTGHLRGTSGSMPSVLIPFGRLNRRPAIRSTDDPSPVA